MIAEHGILGQPPWMADNELELAETVRNMELTYPDDTQYIDPHLKNLLARMLDKNPETRLSMDMVYTHDWVTSEGSEPLDDGSSSTELSTRSNTMPSTPSRQSSGSTSSLLSSSVRDYSRDSRDFRLSRHHGERASSELDMGSSGLSINLPRSNSHTRKISSAKTHMTESVMILADNSDDSTDCDRCLPASPGIASRWKNNDFIHQLEANRGLSASAPSPLTQDSITDPKLLGLSGGILEFSSASTIHSSSPDVEEHSNTCTGDFEERKSLKSTKMTRMTSSNIITHTGELRKALKIIAPTVRQENNYYGDAYDDLDSSGSSHSDFGEDFDDGDVFERRSPPPGFIDPHLPSSMNPLEIRSKSILDENILDLGLSEDELLGKQALLQTKKSIRNIAVRKRHSSSFSNDSVSALSLSPRPSSDDTLPHERDSKGKGLLEGPLISRTGSGRALHKDAGSGLLQRGHSASKMTGKTMSFVLRQKQVQEKQLAAAATAFSRHASARSNGSEEEYCRTLSGGDDVDEELSKYSSELDDVVVMGDDDMEDMFNELITPNVIPQIDLQLAPMIINGHGIRKLLVLKTWAGQSNPVVNLRYGLAESIVSRHTMEDRTTAIASMEALRNRASSKSSSYRPSSLSNTSAQNGLILPEYLGPTTGALENKTLSASFDFSEHEEDIGYISESDGSHSGIKTPDFAESPRGVDPTNISVVIPSDSDLMSTPSSIGTHSHSRGSSVGHLDFAFFGVFDGHGGAGTAEMLQNELHTTFEKRLIYNNSQDPLTARDEEGDDDLYVVRSLTEAVAIVDRRILTADAMRVSEIENARKEMQALSVDTALMNKFGLREEEEEPQNMKLLRKSYLGGLSKSTRSDAATKEGAMSCAFSGSTAVAMIVIRKSGALSSDSHAGQTCRTHDSGNSSSTVRENVVQSDSSYLSPRLPPFAIGGVHVKSERVLVPNLMLPVPSLTKASSFGSVDSVKGSRMSSKGYTDNKGAVRVVIGHVGDCRAVLSDGGTAVELTADHHPCMPAERARVEAAGGVIRSGRVNGVLAVTRSIGDIMYKQFDPDAPVPSCPLEESQENGIWAPSQHVISKPDVVDFLVQPTHEFIVLASDGLWEVISIQQVVNFTRQRLYEHGDIQRASIELIAKAENCGACDNTSVVIVCLNQQDRSSVINTPGRKVTTIPRSYSLASDSSSGSSKRPLESWKMIKRHHSDILSKGSGSGESLGSLSFMSG